MRFQILPCGDLKITAGNPDRSDLAHWCRQGYDHAESVIAEIFHEQLTFIRPERIGALTEAPILTDDADYPDDCMGPAPYPDARIWWYPGYAVSDPWETLAHTGRVVFTLAPVDDAS